MKLTWKRLGALLLVMALIFSCGCGAEPGGSSQPTTLQEYTTDPAPSSTEPPQSETLLDETQPASREPSTEPTTAAPTETDPSTETSIPEISVVTPPDSRPPVTEPTETEPTVTEPASTETDPTVTEPIPTETEPAETTPTVTEPAETEPTVTEPAPTVTEPTETDPTVTEPAPTVTEPTETEPTVTEPAPTVTEPTETEPVETEPTVTEPAPTVTEPTETDPTVTEPPPTEAPTTPAETTPPSDSSFKIHFIDVGQADAALIQCDGENLLIDGGNAGDSNLMYTYLKKQGVTHLDYVIGTHAHEDHIGGVAGALRYADLSVAYCPVTSYNSKAFTNFAKAVQNHGVSLTVPSVGDTFHVGSASCRIVGVNSESDTNNTSIVVRIVYGSTSFLFTGDAEQEAESVILDSGYTLQSTVLKVGHHGSSTSTGYRWLREVDPEYAVISVGKDNTYGHPTENTLSRLRDAEVTTFRTDMQGDIICTSDGTTVTFTVDRNANADTFGGIGGNSTQTEPEEEDATSDGNAMDYVLNTNSKKFHEPTCGSGKRISAKNRKDYHGTREELISQGYSPCGNCDP